MFIKTRIAIEKGDTGSFHIQKTRVNDNRLIFYSYILCVGVALVFIVLRLIHLTVVKGSYYALLADNNRIREVVLEAPRGIITDRKGIVVAANTTQDATSVIEGRSESERTYPFSSVTSTILGYVQIADTQDISQDECQRRLQLGDRIGKKGVESLFECVLRGVNGKKLVEFDAQGQYEETIGLVDSAPGEDIQLALDVKLQEKAYQLMQEKKGAIVALKPTTGEVLTLVSAPSYDPSLFAKNSKAAETLLTDPDKPLFDRATEGQYPPGSTFKPFIASAGLEEGVIDETTQIEDHGFLKAGPQTFYNWYYTDYGRTEGFVDIVKSLQRSNDIFYYELGGKLGPVKIKKWAELFGFNAKTGIGLPETEGLIPSDFWKKDTLGERWYLGDSYNLSIGQGYVSVTPLQLAVATSAFAYDKKICKPQLLKTTSSETNCKDVPISDKTYELVRDGMKAACETGGTGWPLFDFKVATPSALFAQSKEEKITQISPIIREKRIEIGCKTGTAESHAESGKPHAWFTVFAPFDKPEIIVTVLVEEGGQGSDVAAPIAKELLQYYFEQYE
ncbi:hypothetical protein KC726_02875 [Candidatus Woesebacteria bacterium]|nr:hypothetical protein [Candidatus Woesebacteria bacterium]